MNNLIKNPTSCETRTVIRLFKAKILTAAELLQQLSDVYGLTVMSEGEVPQWVRQFKEQTCTMK
jgi:hypothetical protein